jgi:ADP-L-glycero-D-manno-heptose 6-epimerase
MIVVTGGAGFIGSNLLAALEERGLGDLVVCDRLGTGEKWRNIAKRELADIVAPEDLFDFADAHAAEIEVVFHMGAQSDTMETDADLVVDHNFHYTMALWDWCATNDARLIYASSAATYGDGAEGFECDGSTAALARLRPLNLYGWSKHLTDRRIARLVETDAPRPPQWAGLKFFNVYGPNEYHKGPMRSMASQIYDQIETTGVVRLFRSHRADIADDDLRRDFVWVGDAVDIALWLYDNPDVGGLFNVGSGEASSFAELAGRVFEAFEREPEIEYVDMPNELRDRYQYHTRAGTERLRAAGYHRPATPLEEGVARYVRDYLAAADRYR